MPGRVKSTHDVKLHTKSAGSFVDGVTASRRGKGPVRLRTTVAIHPPQKGGER